MDEVRILEIKQSVFKNNDEQADKLRRELKEKGVFLLNLMSSPGAGKTTTFYMIVGLLRADGGTIATISATANTMATSNRLTTTLSGSESSSPANLLFLRVGLILRYFSRSVYAIHSRGCSRPGHTSAA